MYRLHSHASKFSCAAPPPPPSPPPQKRYRISVHIPPSGQTTLTNFFEFFSALSPHVIHRRPRMIEVASTECINLTCPCTRLEFDHPHKPQVAPGHTSTAPGHTSTAKSTRPDIHLLGPATSHQNTFNLLRPVKPLWTRSTSLDQLPAANAPRSCLHLRSHLVLTLLDAVTPRSNAPHC